MPSGAWPAYFWEKPSTQLSPALHLQKSAYSGNPRIPSHPGKVWSVPPIPKGAKGPVLCRWVVWLHIWKGKGKKKQGRGEGASSLLRCRGETPHTNTLSDRLTHTHRNRLTQAQADMLTHSLSNSHCPAGCINSMDWPKENGIKGRWKEGS